MREFPWYGLFVVMPVVVIALPLAVVLMVACYAVRP